jgi:hypothetical protein
MQHSSLSILWCWLLLNTHKAPERSINCVVCVVIDSYSEISYTYEDMVKPIALPIKPARINLENVANSPPCKTCKYCALIVPLDDIKTYNKGSLKVDYERIDFYPNFPVLKASAKLGCGLCKIIRTAIKRNWAVCPMEEIGFGTLKRHDANGVSFSGARGIKK